jgi:hypothetical protein
MKWVDEVKPTNMEKNYFEIVRMPVILIIVYYSLLYIQTLFVTYDMEVNLGGDINTEKIGFAFFFTDIQYRAACMGASHEYDYRFGCWQINWYGMLGIQIFAILAIWGVISTIKSNGNIGNVAISSLIIGILVGLLDIMYLILFLIDEKSYTSSGIIFGPSPQEEFVIIDFISENIEYLYASLLFFVVNFLVTSIILAGIFLGIRSSEKNNRRFELLRVLAIPFLILLIYTFLLFIQTFIGESDPLINFNNTVGSKPLAYIFYFTNMQGVHGCVLGRPFDCHYSFGQFGGYGLISFVTFVLFGIWVAIRNINAHQNLIKTAISAFIFGLVIAIVDLLFFFYYLYLFNTEFLIDSDFILREFINENGKYLAIRSLFYLFQFVIVAVLFAGFYYESIKKKSENVDEILYPISANNKTH